MGYNDINVIDSVPNHSSSVTRVMNDLERGGFTHNMYMYYLQDMVVGIIYMRIIYVAKASNIFVKGACCPM